MSTIEKALAKKGAKQAAQDTTNAGQNEAAKETTIEKASSSTEQGGQKQSKSTSHKKTTTPDGLFLEIDNDALISNGYLSIHGDRSRKSDEYRGIKRKVLSNAFGPLSKTLKNSNIIMVSSARPNEGKTFTAINLAISIALEKDKTVLLVDADVLRPSISRELGVKTENGLMEYLLDECHSIADVLYKTNIDKLRVIPAGRSHHLSTELLSSEKMLKAVDEFSSRYSDRVVIFDTPPLLGINESAVLANLAGQAVIVVEENESKLRLVQQATELLSPDMAKGFVVNKAVRSGSASGDYYYGHYYGASDKK
ncbi:XrtA-associated tyrosine autokinase [Alteromonas flava]|uniref:XrtA-associated tyrosine autokinase n=1 Tax=Alteromonas flava TaxID=2048003 RepID=UPI000C290652|nr:XrtA-associated tyrosine autokinase [Alteromonas flava]